MKYLFCVFSLLTCVWAPAQLIVGTWQQTAEKTCLQQNFKESETEKELTPLMGPSGTTVAKQIVFTDKGSGSEGIFSKGVKKGSSKNEFRYAVRGSELQFLDKKSGLMTQRFVIDSLTESTMVIHNAIKECEARMFSRVK